MTGTFATDISSWQRVVDDTYPNPWLIFRACDGTYRDTNFAANCAWARKNAASGKLAGYTVYAVYEPGADTLGTVKSMVGAPDGHLTVMIDVESWSGKIQGDHSADITALYRALAAWLGDERRVIVYGNQGDLANLYPHRPPAERLIVAAYSSAKPNVPGQIGWQYSDGQTSYPVPAGWPRTAAPFGPSDQNHFDLDPAALAAALGVGDQMSFTIDDVRAAVREELQYALAFISKGGGNSRYNSTASGGNLPATGGVKVTSGAPDDTAAFAALSAKVDALASKLSTSGAVAPTAFTGTVNLTAK